VTNLAASARPTGTLDLRVIRSGQPLPIWPAVPTLREIGQHSQPHRGLDAEVNAWRRANRSHLARGLRKVLLARSLKIPHFHGTLYLTKLRGDGEVLPLGLASFRLVTTAGVRFICDDFNAGANDVNLMKQHGFGTGAVAENVTDTLLGTELTTEYATDNTRVPGSQASATSGANATYTTVATLSPDTGGTIAITEHGIFSTTARATVTLLDRSVFSAVNLVAGSDSLQATYVLTINSGG